MTVAETLHDIAERSAFMLANDADCFSPDTDDSSGAEFLRGVRDDVLEAVKSDRLAEEDASDVAHEVADGRVPIYTHDLWSTFVDLGAYQEDPTEVGEGWKDIEQCARVSLYLIADRLAHALFTEIDQ